MSRWILSCRISWTAMVMWSPPRTSTSGRAPPIQGDHPLLNQRRELETPAHLVDDCFFLQIIEHLELLSN